MKLTCLIIDDEPVARKGLEEYVNEIEFLQLVAQCENPLKASRYLERADHRPDLPGYPHAKGFGYRIFKRPPESSAGDLHYGVFGLCSGRLFTGYSGLPYEAHHL